jgi:signal transduction histidine kinase
MTAASFGCRSATTASEEPTPAEDQGSVGLRDRVEALGGRIEIASPPGDGTSLRVEIPIDGDA